nr:craniofacial development protein 2-like [Onthophagus taurus]
MAIDDDKCKYTMVMGDFNAKVGKRKGESCIDNCGIGNRNENGEKLVEFVEGNKFYIMNTFYNKANDKKWTWISPDGQTKNEIDFFIVDKGEIIQNVEIEQKIDIGSDHRAIKMTVQIIKKRQIPCVKKMISYKSTDELKRENFEDRIKCELRLEEILANPNIENQNHIITKAITKVTKDIQKDTKKEKQRSNLPCNIRKLLNKRKTIKRSGREKIEYTEISKLIRKQWKEWSYNKKIIELEDAITTGGSIRKSVRQQSLGQSKIIVMKDKNGMSKGEDAEILT